ncbi:MAG: DUF3365 domain-containing protein [Verrucomicrobiota bacterium]
MTAKSFVLIAVAGALICAMLAADKSGEKSHKLTSISPRKMADSLHAVIAADRDAYARLIVQRLHADEHRLPATENWREARGLPVHAQMLREAGQNIQKRGAEFSYTLRSLWPINENYGPQTQTEQTGLEHVAQHPGENYYTEELLGGRSYFTAIYADRATLPSCVACHNEHPRSPRRDFKLDDVMGAIVVRLPLEF